MAGELVELDAGDDVGMLGVIAHDVVEDLVVVIEAKIAVRALTGFVIHDLIVPPRGDRR